MRNFLELLYEVMVRPQAAMRIIAAWKPVKQSAAVFIISLVIAALLLRAGLQSAGAEKFGGLIVGCYVLFCLGTWTLGAAVFNLIAEFWGGQANGLGLFAALGFTHWPRIFMAPVWALAVFLPSAARPWIWILGGSLISIWSIVLTVTALRAAHGLTVGRAVLTLLTPLLFLIALLLVLLLLGIIAFPR